MAKNKFIIPIIAIFILSILASIKAQEPYDGYTLFNPHGTNTTYMINMDGEVAHSWKCEAGFSDCVYLLENGNLLRPGRDPNAIIHVGPYGGLIQEIDKDANVVWEFKYSSSTYIQHHDVGPMPNGNVLILAYEKKIYNEAIAAGRDPSKLKDELLPEHIVEVEPDGKRGGNIIWEWHVWDHMVQDYDSQKDNYGVVEDHPELFDINNVAPGNQGSSSDWMHANYVDYNEELDQIVFSSHALNELYVIDHSTTTEEAASRSGGNCGKGGDILYRWGNPRGYGRGTTADQKFFVVHNSHWIRKGLPGEGCIMAFNNGNMRPDGNYSSIDIIDPPLQSDGNYLIEDDAAFGPEEQTWMYTAPNPTDFFSNHIGSAQRLPNGNTLICEGTQGYFFEIDSTGEIVWDYKVNGNAPRCYRYGHGHPGIKILFPTDLTNKVLQKNILSIRNYPNPFSTATTIYFSNPKKSAQIKIYSISGKELFCKCVKLDHFKWDTMDQPCGIYIVKVKIEDKVFSRYINLVK